MHYQYISENHLTLSAFRIILVSTTSCKLAGDRVVSFAPSKKKKIENMTGKDEDLERKKRPVNEVDGKPSIDAKGDSLLGKLLKTDEYFTQRLSVCASSESRFGYLRPLMKFLEISCHGIPWFAFTILGILLAYKPHEIEFFINLFLGLVLDITVVGLTKLIVRRARPSHNFGDMFATVSVDNYSFPSGHATRAAMLLWLFLDKAVSAGSNWCVYVTLWSVSVGVSRVLLGRHYVFDVICGFLIGITQYYLLLQMWLPAEQCVAILEPYLGHFHL